MTVLPSDPAHTWPVGRTVDPIAPPKEPLSRGVKGGLRGVLEVV